MARYEELFFLRILLVLEADQKTTMVTILKSQLAELGIRFNNFNDLAPAATIAANKKTWRKRTRQTSRGQT